MQTPACAGVPSSAAHRCGIPQTLLPLNGTTPQGVGRQQASEPKVATSRSRSAQSCPVTRHDVQTSTLGFVWQIRSECVAISRHSTSVSVSPNISWSWIGSNEGVSPSSARRSAASPIKGTALLHTFTGVGDPRAIDRPGCKAACDPDSRVGQVGDAELVEVGTAYGTS